LQSQQFLGFGLAPDLVRHYDKRLALNDEIIRTATRAVELAPDDATIRRVFARAIATKCQVGVYRQEVQKALALNPNDPNALGFLGGQLANMGDWDEATAMAERAITLAGPTASFTWWYVPGERHFWRGEYQQALEDFQHSYFSTLLY